MAEHSPPPSSLMPLFHLSSPASAAPLQTASPTRPREASVLLAPPSTSVYESQAEPAPVAQIKVLENVEAPAYEDTWVTVFGFGTDSAATSHVLQEFQSCGNIQMWLSPPLPTCNWLYIQFETQHGAQRALQRNGTKLASMGILVGVQPPSAADRQHIGGRQPGGAASASSQPTLPERGYVLSTTRTKDVKVPQILPKTWGQRLSELVLGS